MGYDILWKVHGILMGSSLLAMTTGIFVSLLRKGKKNTYKIHRKLGLIAAGSGLAGILTAFLMVQTSGGLHLSSPHSLLGITTVLLLLSTPLIMLLKKTRTKKPARRVHRFMGFTTLLLMVTTVLSGLYFVGILA